MSEFVYQLDYKGQAKENVVSSLALSARLIGLIEAQAGAIQACEDDLFALATALYLDTASEWGLETWGLILDEPQATLSTVEFRAILQAKIAAIWSDGTVASLYRVSQAALPGSEVIIDEIAPCVFRITMSTAYFMSTEFYNRLSKLLHIAKPAGIKGTKIIAIDNAFAFAGGSGAGFGVGAFSGTI